MINEKVLKEAKEVIGAELFTLDAYLKNSEMSMHHERFKKMIKALKVAYDLAEQVLKVEGLPTHKQCTCPQGVRCECDWGELLGFNLAVDECKLIVARDYIHKSKLLDKNEIEEELIYWLDRPDKDSATFSQSIINRQVEKINEVIK